MTGIIFDVQIESEPVLTVTVVDRLGFVIVVPASVYDHATAAAFDMRVCVRDEPIPRPAKLLRKVVLSKERPEPPAYPGARPARITRFRR